MFGHGLRIIRRKQSVSQTAIAEAAKVRQATVSHWEKTGRVPIEHQSKIADLLGVSINDIFQAGESVQTESRQSVTGFALKEIRELKGLSQAQIAEAIGVHSSTISYWERSGNLPEEHLDAVSATLGITIRELRAKAAQLLASQPVEDEELIATWRDAIMLDNNLEGLVKLLLATWGYFWVDAIKAVSVTPEKLKQKAGWSDEHIQATWAKALATPYVEPIDEEGTLLRLKFPT